MEYIENFDLEQALNSFKPHDDIEEAHVQKLRHFINGDQNIFSRQNLEGHITGSGFLMTSDLSKILLTHHAKLGKWFQFGGHSDDDSNTKRVAARETIEESGIEAIHPLVSGIFDIDIHKIPENIKKQEPSHYHYDIRFMFATDQQQFIVSDESNDLKWFTLDEFVNTVEQSPDNMRFAQKWALMQKSQEKRGSDEFSK